MVGDSAMVSWRGMAERFGLSKRESAAERFGMDDWSPQARAAAAQARKNKGGGVFGGMSSHLSSLGFKEREKPKPPFGGLPATKHYMSHTTASKGESDKVHAALHQKLTQAGYKNTGQKPQNPKGNIMPSPGNHYVHSTTGHTIRVHQSDEGPRSAPHMIEVRNLGRAKAITST